MSTRRIKVVLALDCTLESAGVEALLSVHGDFVVSVLPASNDAPVDWICSARPLVAVLASHRNGASCLPLVSQLRCRLPRSAAVVLARAEACDEASDVFAAGAAAYVMHGTRADDLIASIRAVAEGQHEWGGVLVRAQAQACLPWQNGNWASSERDRDTTSLLTPREREIVALIASSLTTRGIADRLELSPTTIATHRANLMRKLGLHNAAELTRYAWSAGVLPGQREPV